MVFVFFQFHNSPLHFNPNNTKVIKESQYAGQYNHLEDELKVVTEEKKEITMLYVDQLRQDYDNKELHNKMIALNTREKDLRDKAKDLITQANNKAETNDKDYVFLYFILNFLPQGLIGLLLAVIFSAAMSSSASGLNALASTTAIDIYKRNVKGEKSDKHFVDATKLFTLIWGIIAILFACVGTLFENLIQLVNIIGSIFYGTVLGIFLVAFYIKYIKAEAIFWSALVTQGVVIIIYKMDILGYLWLNAIGAAMTIILGLILQMILPSRPQPEFTTEEAV